MPIPSIYAFEGSAEGLLGFFGHRYMYCEPACGDMIFLSFQIIRKIDADRYAVQMYSHPSGEPGGLCFLSEIELNDGRTTQLFASAEIWWKVLESSWREIEAKQIASDERFWRIQKGLPV